MTRRILALAFAWWGSLCCEAQQPLPVPPELQQKLAQIQAAPPSQWLELSAKLVMPWANDEIWAELAKTDSRLKSKASIEVRMEGAEADDAPFTEGTTIVYPALFLAQAALSSFLLSHDLFVENSGHFPVLDPVLQRPYASSVVTKWLGLSHVDMKTPVFVGLLNSLACYNRDPRCSSYQGLAWSATLMFFLLHEYGHIAAGDSGAKEFSYSLDKEVAADLFAFRALKALGSPMIDNEDQRDYYTLGPVALLAVRALTMSAGTARDDLDHRKAPLLKLVPGDSQTEYARLTDRPSTDGGMSPLQIAWNGQPEWIAVDGIFYSPAELAGTTLRVTSDLHEIVAFGPNGVAWAEISGTGDLIKIRLTLQAVSAQAASSVELAQMTKNYLWGEILLKTATAKLEPKSADLAYALFEALEWVHLYGFIDPSLLPPETSERERRAVQMGEEGNPSSCVAAVAATRSEPMSPKQRFLRRQ